MVLYPPHSPHNCLPTVVLEALIACHLNASLVIKGSVVKTTVNDDDNNMKFLFPYYDDQLRMATKLACYLVARINVLFVLRVAYILQ